MAYSKGPPGPRHLDRDRLDLEELTPNTYTKWYAGWMQPDANRSDNNTDSHTGTDEARQAKSTQARQSEID